MTLTVSRVMDPTECYAIRYAVFVGEQKVPIDLERDELDATAVHLLARDGAQPVGAARIVIKGDTGKIGRVCVLKQARGTGLGAALIRESLEILRSTPSVTRAALGAQINALGFYEKLGFTAYGEVFDDAGIDHRMMELRFDI
ncbi:GNAT family N-acetyltransferase [Marivita sp. XM-24bin2]|mgnify:CR=1 FL=1|jgi:predicted GNAT family N-acyltransferase|uniref:GNAT family N-acetyltransferase n=1 Tax=unclassified Marivita TaxID=2632480 RepID=UPI000D7987E7|nr:GNAT family N-acetyltransferase [Marivita sp. XM-24bin2]MCR9108323.1 GNAT family N-acetyltransferase [Paracoccaceae bacterium]PWL36280.1 MAG: drug:proton antiporter [Marivita sp. XM-24bin2]